MFWAITSAVIVLVIVAGAIVANITVEWIESKESDDDPVF